MIRRLRDRRAYRSAVAKLTPAERHALYAANCAEARAVEFAADVLADIERLPSC